MRYWLMKSEPSSFSIEDLKKVKSTLWTGIRNYQARNFMMNEMKPGDLILFYHSNCTPPGISGVAKVKRPAQSDPTQFEIKGEFFDPKSSKQNPRWFCVEIEFVKTLDFLPLNEIKTKTPELAILKKGNRLSITPVEKSDFEELTQ